MKKFSIKLHWALHNIVGHPIMGILQLVGLNSLGTFIHDITVPTVTSHGPIK